MDNAKISQDATQKQTLQENILNFANENFSYKATLRIKQTVYLSTTALIKNVCLKYMKNSQHPLRKKL